LLQRRLDVESAALVQYQAQKKHVSALRSKYSLPSHLHRNQDQQQGVNHILHTHLRGATLFIQVLKIDLSRKLGSNVVERLKEVAKTFDISPLL
jgi:hypothetical protein